MSATASVKMTVPASSLRMPGGGWGRQLALNLVGVALFLLGWQGAHVLVGQYLPPPAVVIQAAYQNLWSSPHFVGLGLPAGGYWPHLVSTTGTAILGYDIGGLVGAASGLVSAHSSTAFQITRPLVGVLGTVPIPVASPFFFLIWFGVSDTAKIILVCLYSAVVLHLYALRAVEHLHPSFQEYARTLGAGPRRIFFWVSLPGCMPELFGGLRTALGAAWGLAAITELLGTDRGIGRVIITTWGVQDITLMMAGLLLLCLVALAADALLMAARRHVTRWMPRTR